MSEHGQVIFVPPHHGFFVFPIPASQPDDRDDATKILDAFAPRGAAPHVANLIDHDERNEIDG